MLLFHGRRREETCRGIDRYVEWRPRGESSVLSFHLEPIEPITASERASEGKQTQPRIGRSWRAQTGRESDLHRRYRH